MSRGLLSRVLCALPLIFLLNTAGCKIASVELELPSFFSSGIDELWFWRHDETTSTYVRAGHIRLHGMNGPIGAQRLMYTLYNPQGEEGLTLDMPVDVSSDSVHLVLWFANWMDDGTFKVSARNAAGESDLSSASVTL